MTQFYFEAEKNKFDPTWIEFHKPIFLGGYGYVGSVGLVAQKEDRPDRPSCAGASKTPDGWLVWMDSGAAALIPETNVKYVGAVRVEQSHRQDDVLQGKQKLKNEAVAQGDLPQSASEQFAHLPEAIRDKVMAQAEGGFAGDHALAGFAKAAEIAGKPQYVSEQMLSPEPAKKRRGRPPKMKPVEATGVIE